MSNSILPLLVCPLTKQDLFLLKGEKAKLLTAALDNGELRYIDGTKLSSELDDVQFLITKNAHHLYSMISGIPVLLESRQIDMQSLQI
ncbi:MAG: terminase small subunit [Proteobacteria bacterium]|nr:terminase small subunit [Pseudomonadota bacterium]